MTLQKCIRKGTIAISCSSRLTVAQHSRTKVSSLCWTALLTYLPSPTEVDPQPEVDLEGNETGEFAHVDINSSVARTGVQNHG